MVTPRTEKERLAVEASEAEEDAGTTRLVARARKAIAAGEETVIPMIEVERIIAKMKRERCKR